MNEPINRFKRTQHNYKPIKPVQDKNYPHHSHKRATVCLPKSQPDIAPYQQFGHPRKGKENLKSR